MLYGNQYHSLRQHPHLPPLGQYVHYPPPVNHNDYMYQFDPNFSQMYDPYKQFNHVDQPFLNGMNYMNFPYPNPYPKQPPFVKQKPSGIQSIMSQFKKNDGQFDMNKMMDTAGQMMNAANQMGSLFKGVTSIFKG